MPWYTGSCRELADFVEPDAPFVQAIGREALPWLEIRTGREYSARTGPNLPSMTGSILRVSQSTRCRWLRTWHVEHVERAVGAP